MAALPVKPLPTFVTNDVSLTKLQQLAYAVQFWTDNDVRPTWHFYKTATMTLTANVWNFPQFGTVAFDSDRVWNGNAATINTAGVYAVETCLQVQAGTSGIGFLVGFLVTVGGRNPLYSAGTTAAFGLRGGDAVSSGADGALCSADVTPFMLYPTDQIAPMVWTTAAVTLDNNSNSSYVSGRFVCNFTGLIIQTP